MTRRDPWARVLVGGLAGSPTSQRDAASGKVFLKAILDDESPARCSFDGVSFHSYAKLPDQVWRTVREIRHVLTDPDIPRKIKAHHAEIWLTEFGWGTDPGQKHPDLSVVPETQAAHLGDTIRKLLRQRDAWRLGPMFWFSYKDEPKHVPEKEQGTRKQWRYYTGLVDDYLNPKSALQALAKQARDAGSRQLPAQRPRC